MKKAIGFVVFFTFVVGLVFISDDAFAWRKKNKEAEAKEEKVEEVVEVEDATAGEAKLVCKFESDEEMAEFEQLYVSKQATFGRIGVLQAYFAMEQDNLTEIDRQMEERFGFRMDLNRRIYRPRSAPACQGRVLRQARAEETYGTASRNSMACCHENGPGEF